MGKDRFEDLDFIDFNDSRQQESTVIADMLAAVIKINEVQIFKPIFSHKSFSLLFFYLNISTASDTITDRMEANVPMVLF